jgi:hypothetical protein
MNIFALHASHYESARLLFDLDPLRARKQIVELCQMMATLVPYDVPKADGTHYRKNKSIRNHPATIWALDNYGWCRDYLYELLDCYFRRTGKVHGCYSAWESLGDCSLYVGYPHVKFGWHTKRVALKDFDVGGDVFLANTLYLLAKRDGWFNSKGTKNCVTEFKLALPNYKKLLLRCQAGNPLSLKFPDNQPISNTGNN